FPSPIPLSHRRRLTRLRAPPLQFPLSLCPQMLSSSSSQAKLTLSRTTSSASPSGQWSTVGLWLVVSHQLAARCNKWRHCPPDIARSHPIFFPAPTNVPDFASLWATVSTCSGAEPVHP